MENIFLMKKIQISIFILSLFFAVISFAQANETTLPLSFNSGNPSPYGMASTAVTINGKKIALLVDLGASKEFFAVTPKAIKGIKVHFTGNKICGKSLTGKACYPDIIIAKFKIGQFTIHNIHAALINKLWGGNSPKKIPGAFQYGVIGMKFLSQYNVLFDYPHAKLILAKHNYFPRAYRSYDWIKIPFALDGGVMTTTQINNHAPVKLIWDTGAVPSIINSNNTFGSTPTHCPHDLPYPICQKKLLKPLLYTKQFSVDGKKLPNTWFKLEKLPSFVPFTGLVGDNYFRNNLIFVNFKNKTIWIHSDVKI